MGLYPLLLTPIRSVVITEDTLPDLKASFMRSLAEWEHHNPADSPTEDVIRRITNDPDTFVNGRTVQASA